MGLRKHLKTMNRFIFTALMLCLIAGCSKIDPNQQKDYGFNDDFYYNIFSSTTDYIHFIPPYDKIYLTPCPDEYYIRFDTEHKEEVMKKLRKRGFQITRDPVDSRYGFDDFEIPDYLEYCSTVSVKGSGKISDIPHVIYSNHLYKLGEAMFGRSNRFHVFYEYEQADEQLKTIFKYAEEFKIHPIQTYKFYGTPYWLISFACTNDSAGNPVELANWFTEAGFPAYPDNGAESSPAGVGY